MNYELYIRSLLAMLTVLVGLSGCLSIGPNLERSGSIFIEDPVMAKATDDQNNPIDPTTAFKTTDKRMYCTISIKGPDGVRLGARWYYGDRLITDQVIDFGTQRRAAWFLESPPGGSFPAGDYRIEIYLVHSPDKVVYFTVVK